MVLEKEIWEDEISGNFGMEDLNAWKESWTVCMYFLEEEGTLILSLR